MFEALRLSTRGEYRTRPGRRRVSPMRWTLAAAANGDSMRTEGMPRRTRRGIGVGVEDEDVLGMGPHTPVPAQPSTF